MTYQELEKLTPGTIIYSAKGDENEIRECIYIGKNEIWGDACVKYKDNGLIGEIQSAFLFKNDIDAAKELITYNIYHMKNWNEQIERLKDRVNSTSDKIKELRSKFHID